MRPLPLLLAIALLAALATPAWAQVEIVVQADGTRVVRNVAEAEARADERVRRSSSREASRPSTPAPPPWRPAPSPELARVVRHHAGLHGLDPRLVEAVIQAESAWNGRAVSRAGAMGLMQLMPDTALMLAVHDPWDEVENVRGGTAYLARMIDRFDHLELALAAYNAGPTAVERFDGIPPYRETREYVRRVLSLYEGRWISPSELEPFHGSARHGSPRHGTARSRDRGGASPRFVRGEDGRLVLTNESVRRTVARPSEPRTAPAAPAGPAAPAPR